MAIPSRGARGDRSAPGGWPTQPLPPQRRPQPEAGEVVDPTEEPTEAPEDATAAPAGFVGNILAVLAPLAIGIGGLVMAVRMGLGSLTAPGPGLWPGIICAALTVLSLVLLAGGRRFHDAEALTRGSLPVLVAVATLLALVVAMPYVGFEIPTALIAFVWLAVLGRERWLLSAVTAVVLTAVLWLLFVQLFDVPLPHLI